MIALCAVVFFPRITFHADSMFTAKVLCFFSTARFAQLTVIAGIGAAFAEATFLTQISAVCTNISAVCTDRLHTVAAVMAVLTHHIGTVKTDTAVGTVFVHTVSTFAAVRTAAFRAVAADDTAFFTEIGTVTAQKTDFTQKFIRTMDTTITGSAECITAD